MSPEHSSILIAIVVLIFLSAFFGFAETSLSFVNKVRLKTMVETGNKKAARVLRMSENFDNALSTILVGNNLVNITIASLATVLFTGLISDASLAVTLSTAITTIIILIFAEVTPKSIAKEKPESYAMFISGPLQLLIWVLWPVNAVFMLWKRFLTKVFKLENKDRITDDELINYVEAALEEGGIDERDSQLIKSAIEFDHVSVKDIMTPRVNVVAIAENATIKKIGALFREEGFSRLPVYSGTIDNIIGQIHIRDFYAFCIHENKPLKDIVQPSICVSEGMKINEVLQLLQEAKVHFAFVVDEHGATSRILTMLDIIEQ